MTLLYLLIAQRLTVRLPIWRSPRKLEKREGQLARHAQLVFCDALKDDLISCFIRDEGHPSNTLLRLCITQHLTVLPAYRPALGSTTSAPPSACKIAAE
jgi:hypothetical protein